MKVWHIPFLVVTGFVSGCAQHGVYTGSTSYGGGDENGVTIYKTIYSSQSQVKAEAVLHCKKYDKVSRFLSCSSILVNSCTFACDESSSGKQDPSTRPHSDPRP